MAGGFDPLLQIFLPFGVCVSLHPSYLKMLQKATSVALATPAAASFDGAALQRMKPGPGNIQHEALLFCVTLMWECAAEILLCPEGR